MVGSVKRGLGLVGYGDFLNLTCLILTFKGIVLENMFSLKSAHNGCTDL